MTPLPDRAARLAALLRRVCRGEAHDSPYLAVLAELESLVRDVGERMRQVAIEEVWTTWAGPGHKTWQQIADGILNETEAIITEGVKHVDA